MAKEAGSGTGGTTKTTTKTTKKSEKPLVAYTSDTDVDNDSRSWSSTSKATATGASSPASSYTPSGGSAPSAGNQRYSGPVPTRDAPGQTLTRDITEESYTDRSPRKNMRPMPAPARPPEWQPDSPLSVAASEFQGLGPQQQRDMFSTLGAVDEWSRNPTTYTPESDFQWGASFGMPLGIEGNVIKNANADRPPDAYRREVADDGSLSWLTDPLNAGVRKAAEWGRPFLETLGDKMPGTRGIAEYYGAQDERFASIDDAAQAQVVDLERRVWQAEQGLIYSPERSSADIEAMRSEQDESGEVGPQRRVVDQDYVDELKQELWAAQLRAGGLLTASGALRAASATEAAQTAMLTSDFVVGGNSYVPSWVRTPEDWAQFQSEKQAQMDESLSVGQVLSSIGSGLNSAINIFSGGFRGGNYSQEDVDGYWQGELKTFWGGTRRERPLEIVKRVADEFRDINREVADLPPDQQLLVEPAVVMLATSGYKATRDGLNDILTQDEQVAAARQELNSALMMLVQPGLTPQQTVAAQYQAAKAQEIIDRLEGAEPIDIIQNRTNWAADTVARILLPDPSDLLLDPIVAPVVGAIGRGVGRGAKAALSPLVRAATDVADETAEAAARRLLKEAVGPVADEIIGAADTYKAWSGYATPVAEFFGRTKASNVLHINTAWNDTLAVVLSHAQTKDEARVILQSLLDGTLYDANPNLASAKMDARIFEALGYTAEEAAALADTGIGRSPMLDPEVIKTVPLVKMFEDEILGASTLSGSGPLNRAAAQSELVDMLDRRVRQTFEMTAQDVVAGTNNVRVIKDGPGWRLHYYDGDNLLSVSDEIYTTAGKAYDARQNVMTVIEKFKAENHPTFSQALQRLLPSNIRQSIADSKATQRAISTAEGVIRAAGGNVDDAAARVAKVSGSELIEPSKRVALATVWKESNHLMQGFLSTMFLLTPRNLIRNASNAYLTFMWRDGGMSWMKDAVITAKVAKILGGASPYNIIDGHTTSVANPEIRLAGRFTRWASDLIYGNHEIGIPGTAYSLATSEQNFRIKGWYSGFSRHIDEAAPRVSADLSRGLQDIGVSPEVASSIAWKFDSGVREMSPTELRGALRAQVGLSELQPNLGNIGVDVQRLGSENVASLEQLLLDTPVEQWPDALDGWYTDVAHEFADDLVADPLVPTNIVRPTDMAQDVAEAATMLDDVAKRAGESPDDYRPRNRALVADMLSTEDELTNTLIQLATDPGGSRSPDQAILYFLRYDRMKTEMRQATDSLRSLGWTDGNWNDINPRLQAEYTNFSNNTRKLIDDANLSALTPLTANELSEISNDTFAQAYRVFPVDDNAALREMAPTYGWTQEQWDAKINADRAYIDHGKNLAVSTFQENPTPQMFYALINAQASVDQMGRAASVRVHAARVAHLDGKMTQQEYWDFANQVWSEYAEYGNARYRYARVEGTIGSADVNLARWAVSDPNAVIMPPVLTDDDIITMAGLSGRMTASDNGKQVKRRLLNSINKMLRERGDNVKEGAPTVVRIVAPQEAAVQPIAPANITADTGMSVRLTDGTDGTIKQVLTESDTTAYVIDVPGGERTVRAADIELQAAPTQSASVASDTIDIGGTQVGVGTEYTVDNIDAAGNVWVRVETPQYDQVIMLPQGSWVPTQTAGGAYKPIKNLSDLTPQQRSYVFRRYFEDAQAAGVDVYKKWYDYRNPQIGDWVELPGGDNFYRQMYNLENLMSANRGMQSPSINQYVMDQLAEADRVRRLVLANPERVVTNVTNDLTPDQQARVLQLINRVGQNWEDEVYNAIEAGKRVADRAMLNYKDRRGFDEAASLLFPFHFFWSRSLKNWGQAVLQKPSIAYDIYLMEKALTQENAQHPELPARAGGSIPNPFLTAAENVGWDSAGEWLPQRTYWPLRYILPYAPFDDYTDPSEANSNFERWWMTAGMFTPGMYPHWQILGDWAGDAIERSGVQYGPFTNMSPTENEWNRVDRNEISDMIPLLRIASAASMWMTGKPTASIAMREAGVPEPIALMFDSGGTLSFLNANDDFTVGRVGRAIRNAAIMGEVDPDVAKLSIAYLDNIRMGLPPTSEMVERLEGEGGIYETVKLGTRDAGYDQFANLVSSYLLGLPSQRVPEAEQEYLMLMQQIDSVGYSSNNDRGSAGAQDYLLNQTGPGGVPWSDVKGINYSHLYMPPEQAIVGGEQQSYTVQAQRQIRNIARQESVALYEQQSKEITEALLSYDFMAPTATPQLPPSGGDMPPSNRDELEAQIKAIEDKYKGLQDELKAKYPTAGDIWTSDRYRPNTEGENPYERAQSELQAIFRYQPPGKPEYKSEFASPAEEFEYYRALDVYDEKVYHYIERVAEQWAQGDDTQPGARENDTVLARAVIGRYVQELIDANELRFSSGVEIEYRMNERFYNEAMQPEWERVDGAVIEQFGKDGYNVYKGYYELPPSPDQKSLSPERAAYIKAHPELKEMQVFAADPEQYNEMLRRGGEDVFEALSEYPSGGSKAQKNAWYNSHTQGEIDAVHSYFGWSKTNSYETSMRYHDAQSGAIGWSGYGGQRPLYNGPTMGNYTTSILGGSQPLGMLGGPQPIGIGAQPGESPRATYLDAAQPWNYPDSTGLTPRDAVGPEMKSYVDLAHQVAMNESGADRMIKRGEQVEPGIPGVSAPPATSAVNLPAYRQGQKDKSVEMLRAELKKSVQEEPTPPEPYVSQNKAWKSWQRYPWRRYGYRRSSKRGRRYRRYGGGSYRGSYRGYGGYGGGYGGGGAGETGQPLYLDFNGKPVYAREFSSWLMPSVQRRQTWRANRGRINVPASPRIAQSPTYSVRV